MNNKQFEAIDTVFIAQRMEWKFFLEKSFLKRSIVRKHALC